jgi:hypothetical protein
MSCCGSKRTQFYRPGSQATVEAGTGIRALDTGSVLYRYTGPTGLTVQGPITGRRYRFNGEGAQVEVDSRDAPSFGGVPKLQRVRVADRDASWPASEGGALSST